MRATCRSHADPRLELCSPGMRSRFSRAVDLTFRAGPCPPTPALGRLLPPRPVEMDPDQGVYCWKGLQCPPSPFPLGPKHRRLTCPPGGSHSSPTAARPRFLNPDIPTCTWQQFTLQRVGFFGSSMSAANLQGPVLAGLPLSGRVSAACAPGQVTEPGFRRTRPG